MSQKQPFQRGLVVVWVIIAASVLLVWVVVVVVVVVVVLVLSVVFFIGRLGVMDYVPYQNVRADTDMRNSIAGEDESGGGDKPLT